MPSLIHHGGHISIGNHHHHITFVARRYTGWANKNRTPKRTLIFRFTCNENWTDCCMSKSSQFWVCKIILIVCIFIHRKNIIRFVKLPCSNKNTMLRHNDVMFVYELRTMLFTFKEKCFIKILRQEKGWGGKRNGLLVRLTIFYGKSSVTSHLLITGRKHFSESVMASVAVSKAGKTSVN